MKHSFINLKLFTCFCLLSFFSYPLMAQGGKDIVFHDAKQFTLIGKANSSTHYYHRVDTSIYSGLPKGTKRLFSNSSGLAIAFKTNSKKIEAKWSLTSYSVGNNMTAIVHSGLDLYIKEKGRWIPAGAGRPSGVDSKHVIVDNMDDTEKECLLYLPLYNTVESLEIGINSDATIASIPNPFENRIAIYGSSITQGASASRAGMSYTSRISRDTGKHIFNLGVSGSGKMEKEAAQLMADIEADMYVLDCAANPSPKEITERTNYMVKHIRATHPTKPIVMIQAAVRESGNFDQSIRKRGQDQRLNFETEYKRLIKEGVKDLYFIEGDNLRGHDHEGTTDGVHPNDIGFTRMVDVIQPRLMKILKKYSK